MEGTYLRGLLFKGRRLFKGATNRGRALIRGGYYSGLNSKVHPLKENFNASARRLGAIHILRHHFFVIFLPPVISASSNAQPPPSQLMTL